MKDELYKKVYIHSVDDLPKKYLRLISHIKDEEKEEQERIDKLKCPSCKSTDKEHIIKSNSNGIIGPGYHSWLIDEYFVCNNCGIMFKDISKRKK